MSRDYKCLLKHCGFSSKSSSGSSPFPSNQEYAQKWAQALQIQNVKLHQRLCHSHFDPVNDFHRGDNGFKRLKSTAVPSINLQVSFALIKTFKK